MINIGVLMINIGVLMIDIGVLMIDIWGFVHEGIDANIVFWGIWAKFIGERMVLGGDNFDFFDSFDKQSERKRGTLLEND